MKKRNSRIIALAYFHRYGWIAVMLICFIITKSLYTIGAFSIAFSIWSLIGYRLKWKHIFCSYQNAYHMSMTPNRISWDIIRKSDAYGIPAILFVVGVGSIIVQSL